MKRVRFLVGVSLIAATGACAGRGLPPEPESYVAADAVGAERAAELAASPAATWLDDMNSAEMSMLAREALAASPDLQIVEVARTRHASGARSARLGASLLPNLSVGLDGSRQETPAGGGVRIREDVMTSSVIASWEIDLWGRLSARAIAADLGADAALQDLDGARLSVPGQTARAWVDLIEAQQLLALAQEDLQTRERALDLTQRRYEAGVAASLALRTARSQVASARGFQAQAARIAACRVAPAAGTHGPLSGRHAGAREGDLPQLAPLAAAGAPEDLLERRPDVLAAEDAHARRRFPHSRSARCDAAAPHAVGERRQRAHRRHRQSGVGDIDDSVNMISNVVGGLTMPIFKAAPCSLNRAPPSLTAARRLRRMYAPRSPRGAKWKPPSAPTRASKCVKRSLPSRPRKRARRRIWPSASMRRGVATLFELIDAYTRRIDAERGLITARAARVSNRISYHVALGGGARTGGIDEDREAAP